MFIQYAIHGTYTSSVIHMCNTSHYIWLYPRKNERMNVSTIGIQMSTLLCFEYEMLYNMRLCDIYVELCVARFVCTVGICYT